MYWLPPSLVKQSGKATTQGGIAPVPISRSSRSGMFSGKFLPVGVRRPARGEADEIDQQRQAAAVMPGRHIDIDDALGRIAEQIALEHAALDFHPMDLAWFCAVITPHSSPIGSASHLQWGNAPPRRPRLRPYGSWRKAPMKFGSQSGTFGYFSRTAPSVVLRWPSHGSYGRHWPMPLVYSGFRT